MKKDPYLVDVMGNSTSFMLVVSIDIRYCGNFRHNYSGFMRAFVVHFLGREVLRLL